MYLDPKTERIVIDVTEEAEAKAPPPVEEEVLGLLPGYRGRRLLRRRKGEPGEPPPPPPPPPGSFGTPTPILQSYQVDNGAYPTEGSPVPTKCHRRAYLNILHASLTGSGSNWVPVLRQIQWEKAGGIQVDVTRDFSFAGWGFGSGTSHYTWEVLRIHSPGNSPGGDTLQVVFASGSQTFRVRDLFANGALTAWTAWGELNLTWPPDYPVDANHWQYITIRNDD